MGLDDESEESNVNAVDGAADVSLVLIIAVSSGAAALLAIMLVLRRWRWQKLKSKRAILVSEAAMAVADAVLASPNKLETRNYGNQLCRILDACICRFIRPVWTFRHCLVIW